MNVIARISLLLIAILVLAFAVPPSTLFATQEYARQTRLNCKDCHVDASGGGPLTETGQRFLEQMKARGEYRDLSPGERIVRLIIGYLHLMAAILWFGTIMYVHILLKPAYASKGLPKGEMRVGLISMFVILITGVLLTAARVPSFETLYTTKFGILLSIKISLFLVMFSSAIIVVIFIRPLLRRRIESPVADLIAHTMTLEQLAHFDGKESRPSYIAYKGIIYDVTHGRLWKSGIHALKHGAGIDLTDSLKNAPHGEDKILTMPQVATLNARKPEQPFHMKFFYAIAYMNLVLVFVVTFVIALLRWW
jgi:predicted heme/steroid binding protein/uncharacterized membrane protein